MLRAGHVLAFPLAAPLLEVVPVVPPGAEDVPAEPADRGEQPHLRQPHHLGPLGDRLGGPGQPRVAGLHQVHQVAVAGRQQHQFAVAGQHADPLSALVDHGRQLHAGSTAIALISTRYSGAASLLTSTMVEAGRGGRKYCRRTSWMAGKSSMLRT